MRRYYGKGKTAQEAFDDAVEKARADGKEWVTAMYDGEKKDGTCMAHVTAERKDDDWKGN
jgi:hypothetical protein